MNKVLIFVDLRCMALIPCLSLNWRR